MKTRKAFDSSIGRQQKACRGRPLIAAALLFGMAWYFADAALGEDGNAPFESSFEVSTANNDDWQELDAGHLDGIRGRYVPATELELDEPLGVVLWDESRGGHSGGSTDSSHSSQQGSNQQRQSLRTTSVR